MSRPSAISPDVFVRVWQAASSAKAAAAALGMTREGARARARLYRARGIQLRRFSSGSAQPCLDVNRLRELARRGSP